MESIPLQSVSADLQAEFISSKLLDLVKFAYLEHVDVDYKYEYIVRSV